MAGAWPVCYHGAMSKLECEEMLSKKNKDGAYLIRDSETIQGAMCLCVYKQRVVYTYRVLQTHTGHYTIQVGMPEMLFKTLDDMIRHYKRRNQGLAMHLRHSVKRKTALQVRTPHQQAADGAADPPDYENVNADADDEYVEVLPS
uniref:SH2 domain-containing protein n=1 Tax=Myripristis murdjan TaxID=586833 RepID=A0A667YIM2_9TELE